MSFTRQEIKTFVIDFDEDTFVKSKHYKNFVINNPKLQDHLDKMICEFILWAECWEEGYTDPCFNHQIPDYGKYNINTRYIRDFKNKNKNKNKKSEIQMDDYDVFIAQMGTTGTKFSLTELISGGLSSKIILLIANVFNDIGVKTFVAEYTDHYEYFKYKFTALKDFVGPIRNDVIVDGFGNKVKLMHICLCVD